ncbi:MAG: HAMP domain-containing histidine kinase [Desulfarculaceae bacterium]|nr:HAMP domain-containing histidine kinase [Desulfarculaceae bacterium]
MTKTVAFRLTLWYAGVFSISSMVVFVLFYLLVSQTMLNRIDRDLSDKLSLFSAVLSRKGMVGARHQAIIEAQAAGEKMVFFRLLYPDGEVFASSSMGYWSSVEADGQALRQVLDSGGRGKMYQTIRVDSRNQRVRILYGKIAENVILQTGLAMKTYAGFVESFKTVFLSAMTFIVLFSAVTGWLMSRKALAGVGKMTATARMITGRSLSERVPETGTNDDLDLLAATFNRMLDRIETLVTNTRRMNDNIAHDLKSPVARMRGCAEIALVQEDSMEEYRKMAETTIEESDRLLEMINTMLLISKAESGQAGFHFQSFDFSGMVEKACELFEPLFEESGIEFTYHITADVCVNGDRGMLQRAFSNLLDNAVKYIDKLGSVSVELKISGENQVETSVSDTGPGIDSKDKEKIFERFFRADPSRSDAGTGLGLSLVKTVVEGHGGTIHVESGKGSGSTFLLRLPYRNVQVI